MVSLNHRVGTETACSRSMTDISSIGNVGLKTEFFEQSRVGRSTQMIRCDVMKRNSLQVYVAFFSKVKEVGNKITTFL